MQELKISFEVCRLVRTFGHACVYLDSKTPITLIFHPNDNSGNKVKFLMVDMFGTSSFCFAFTRIFIYHWLFGLRKTAKRWKNWILSMPEAWGKCTVCPEMLSQTSKSTLAGINTFCQPILSEGFLYCKNLQNTYSGGKILYL